MVYNDWWDPESEMIQDAIIDFLDKIDDGDISAMAERRASSRYGYLDDMMAFFDEMLEEYQIEYTENTYFDFCEELERKLELWILNNV